MRNISWGKFEIYRKEKRRNNPSPPHNSNDSYCYIWSIFFMAFFLHICLYRCNFYALLFLWQHITYIFPSRTPNNRKHLTKMKCKPFHFLLPSEFKNKSLFSMDEKEETRKQNRSLEIEFICSMVSFHRYILPVCRQNYFDMNIYFKTIIIKIYQNYKTLLPTGIVSFRESRVGVKASLFHHKSLVRLPVVSL